LKVTLDVAVAGDGDVVAAAAFLEVVMPLKTRKVDTIRTSSGRMGTPAKGW
jgi:hypothetical protein